MRAFISVFIVCILQLNSEHLLFFTLSLNDNIYGWYSPGEIREFIVITFSLNDSIIVSILQLKSEHLLSLPSVQMIALLFVFSRWNQSIYCHYLQFK